MHSTVTVLDERTDLCAVTLMNDAGMRVHLLNHGATLARIQVPGATGELTDVVMTLPTLDDYPRARNFLGGTVGRIVGRVRDGQWTHGETTTQLVRNDGANHIHGGDDGLDTRQWAFRCVSGPDTVGVIFTLVDEAGHNGYPGNVKFTVTYTLDQNNALHYTLTAVADAMTVLNPTNHVYFRLSGPHASVEADTLQLAADWVLPLDDTSLPTGKRQAVAETAFDFRTARKIGAALTANKPQIQAEGGLNHPFLLNGTQPAAVLTSADDSRRMTMTTNAPAVVVYTGNHFAHTGVAKNLGAFDGVALECQVAPSAGHNLDAITVMPGEEFVRAVTWAFDY